MVAYSFQRRFVSHVVAGLEPGPWLPGMKRHTLRVPRAGRQGHGAPGQPVHLYTAMRTKHCRQIGVATARVQIPVTLAALKSRGELMLFRREGVLLGSEAFGLAPIVRGLIHMPVDHSIAGDEMEEFARTDGFADVAEVLAFFDPPDSAEPIRMGLVLIAWTPREAA